MTVSKYKEKGNWEVGQKCCLAGRPQAPSAEKESKQNRSKEFLQTPVHGLVLHV